MAEKNNKSRCCNGANSLWGRVMCIDRPQSCKAHWMWHCLCAISVSVCVCWCVLGCWLKAPAAIYTAACETPLLAFAFFKPSLCHCIAKTLSHPRLKPTLCLSVCLSGKRRISICGYFKPTATFPGPASRKGLLVSIGRIKELSEGISDYPPYFVLSH